MAGKKKAVEQIAWPLVGMTVEETADALRIHKRNVLQLIRERGLPAKKCGVSWRIDPDALKRWLGDGNNLDEDDNEIEDE